MTHLDESKRCWKIEQWPAVDQILWAQNLAPLGPFDDPRYGPQLCAVSQKKVRKGYGRWLCFLSSRGWLDPTAAPLARATKRRLSSYYTSLLHDGNRDYTVIGRASELKMALKILSQEDDVRWVQSPHGHTVYARLNKEKRDIIIPDSRTLFAWGFDLMDNSHRRPTDRERLCAYRDGLMITMFASRARRLRSMALLRINYEFTRDRDRYAVSLGTTQVKTKKADRFTLPANLTARIDIYLNEIRPVLLNGNNVDHLWISARGGPLSEKAIQYQILYRSEKRIGTAFGPHRFRHSVATTAPLAAPENPGLAAGLLGISREIVQENYNRASQVEAALKFDRLLASQVAADKLTERTRHRS